MYYPHVKITVERCDKIKVAVLLIFDGVKSVVLWSANIRKLAKDHKSYGSAAKSNLSCVTFQGKIEIWSHKRGGR